MKNKNVEKKNDLPAMMHFGKNIAEMDKSFDIKYWQGQGEQAIFQAAWEMVEFYLRSRKIYESRLQRTVENFQRTRG